MVDPTRESDAVIIPARGATSSELVVDMPDTDDDLRFYLDDGVVYVDEESVVSGNKYTKQVIPVAESEKARCVIVSGWTAERITWLLSRILIDLVFLPSVTSINFFCSFATSLIFLMGDDFGLAMTRTLLATTELPNPTLIKRWFIFSSLSLI